jgi:two-component system response regulator YesN
VRDPLPHILIVDDDPAVREALSTALARTYTPHAAATGDDACAILRSSPIAATILDVRLGAEDGVALIAPFRSLSGAPVLVLTGYGSEELAVRALRANASDYLKKPVNLHELRARLARWVPQVGTPADLVARARLLLEEHLEKEFDGKHLAGQVGLCEAHLRRRFREVHGMTPQRYLTEARLRRAADLLGTTRWSAERIVRRVGFSDLRWFRRLFKLRFGKPPSAFRVSPDRQQNGE